MQIGDTTALWTHRGQIKTVVITNTGHSHDLKQIFVTQFGSFYQAAENGRHYNVGYRAFWIEEL